MRICVRSHLWLCCIVVAGGLGLRAHDVASAQKPPAPLSSLANNNSFTESERQQIAAWAQYWAKPLVTGELEKVVPARERLTEPLSGPQSAIFRTTYAEQVVQALQPAKTSDRPFVASNVFRVITSLGTESALEQLRDHLAKNNEERWHVRLEAARGCRHIFERVREGRVDLTQRSINPVVRELYAAVQQEDRTLVLRRQLEALIVAVQTVRGFRNVPRNGDLVTAEEQLINALRTVVNGIDEVGKSPSEKFDALYPALARLRDVYVRLERNASTRAFGRQLAPVLGTMLEVADTHWPDAQGHEQVNSTYQGVVSAAEALLSVIDLRVRMNAPQPDGNASGAWREGNRTRFKSTIEQWGQILNRHPYQ